MVALTPNKEKAAILLVSGMAAKDVASAVNCTPETISHWKKETEFKALLNCLRRELLEQGRERLRGSIADAMDTLRDIMVNSENQEVRRKAAMDVLRMSGFDGDIQDAMARYTWGIDY